MYSIKTKILNKNTTLSTYRIQQYRIKGFCPHQFSGQNFQRCVAWKKIVMTKLKDFLKSFYFIDSKNSLLRCIGIKPDSYKQCRPTVKQQKKISNEQFSQIYFKTSFNYYKAIKNRRNFFIFYYSFKQISNLC